MPKPSRASQIAQRILDLSPRAILSATQRGVYRFVRDQAIQDLAAGNDAVAAYLSSGRDVVQQRDYTEIAPAESGLTQELGGAETEIARVFTNIWERHLFTSICVNRVAQSVAQGRFEFLERTRGRDGGVTLEPAEDHEWAQQFDYWNEYQSQMECWEYVAAWLELTGTAYIALTSRGPRTPQGVPYEMFPLYPYGVKVIKGRGGLIGYEYNITGESAFFTPEEVWTVKLFNTRDRFTGLGKTFSGLLEIDTDQRARVWNKQLIENGVHVAGTLETPDSMGDDAIERNSERFRQKYAGQNRPGRVAILTQGLTFKPHTLAHKDIMWIEQLQLNKEDLASAYGIPLEMFQKSANFATYQGKRKAFWTDTIMVTAHRITNAINTSLLPRVAPGYVTRFDYSHIDALQEDRLEQIKAGQIAIGTAQYTPNEWRMEVRRAEPIAGGDEPFIPRGWVPLTEALTSAAETIGAAIAPNGNGTSPASPIKAAVHAGALPLSIRQALPVQARAEEDEWRDIFERNAMRGEKHYELMVRQEMRRWEDEIVAYIEGGRDISELPQFAFQVIVGSGSRAMIREGWPLLQETMRRYGVDWLAQTELGGALDLRNFRAERILGANANRIRGITSRQWQGLREAMVGGLEVGTSEAQMADIVRGYFVEQRKGHAATIARTEVVGAVNGASEEMARLAKEAGVPTLLEWLATPDERVRETHWAANGQRINPGETAFNVGASSLRFPGDPNGAAEEVINCRCTTMPIVEAKPQ